MNRTCIPSLGAALLLATACQPSIPQVASPSTVVTANFDPVSGAIMLPSDIVISPFGLASLPATTPPAQKDLLQAFGAAGGFPSDQEVAITVGFTRENIAASGAVTRLPLAALDLATVTDQTFLVWGVTAAGSGPLPTETPAPGDYDAATGTLTLHHKGRQPWAPGQYFAFLRGGPSGVKTGAGETLWASPVFHLLAQAQDMTTEANVSILAAQTGSVAAALPLARQLNILNFGCTAPPCGAALGLASAYPAADTRFPHQELAAATTFKVAPALTQVELDPGRGLVPLPIDLLRDPRPASASCAACGKLTPLAACTLAGGKLDAAGACSSGAAAGFAALDGFSTTAPILAPTSDLVDVTTVTEATLKLYLLTAGGPVLVDPASYVTEPCEFASSGLSPVIAIQPAGATGCADPLHPVPSIFRTRPLQDATEYALVIGKAIKDKTGAALASGTAAKILMFTHPVADLATGASFLQGIDGATASALETMRLKLAPVLALTGVSDIPRASVAMAYTFRTQSILGLAAQLALLPYAAPPQTAGPITAVTSLTPAQAFAKYGVSAAQVPGSGAADHIGEVLEVDILTFDLIDGLHSASGAFHPSAGDAVPSAIHVLLAAPKAGNAHLAPCPAATGTPLKCAPMMIFRHGLGGGRADMLTVADGFAAQGLVVAAIDAPLHGDRAYCNAGDSKLPGSTTPVCADGSACSSVLLPGAQGDARPPGTCAAGYTKRPVSAACLASPASCGWAGPLAGDGVPFISANFLVSANFFRTRDSFRQDIIDESQLVRAIAYDPRDTTLPPNSVYGHLAGEGFIIDPDAVYYSGQSLGAIHGTMTVAANPRVKKAVLNVGGGTVVDIFTQSPAFAASTQALLSGLGIAPGTSAYLQFLAVAKTILDPADPVNYAGHLTANTLPNLNVAYGGNLGGTVPQAPKKILTQVALCDQVVPNAFGYLWASNAGTGPLPIAPTFGLPASPGAAFSLFFKMGAAPPTPTELAAAVNACAVPGATSANQVSHGFITDWADPLITAQAQADAAAFVFSDTPPNSLVVLP